MERKSIIITLSAMLRVLINLVTHQHKEEEEMVEEDLVEYEEDIIDAVKDKVELKEEFTASCVCKRDMLILLSPRKVKPT